MPYGYNPDRRPLNAVEEAIRLDDDLSIGEFGKLWNKPTRVGETFKPAQYGFGLFPETTGSRRVVPVDVGNRFQKLRPA